MEYINDVDCPDVAFSFESDILYIFLKTSVYDYVTTTRFVVFGKRFSYPISSINDDIDVRESDIELFSNYVIREAAQIQGKRVPPEIERNIQILEEQLKGE